MNTNDLSAIVRRLIRDGSVNALECALECDDYTAANDMRALDALGWTPHRLTKEERDAIVRRLDGIEEESEERTPQAEQPSAAQADETLAQVWAELDGKEWSADTLERIAAILARHVGRDPNPPTNDETESAAQADRTADALAQLWRVTGYDGPITDDAHSLRASIAALATHTEQRIVATQRRVLELEAQLAKRTPRTSKKSSKKGARRS